MTKKAVVLRVVVNYSGTEFFTKDENGYFKPHKTLESARDHIMHTYGCDTAIKIETSVRFSY